MTDVAYNSPQYGYGTQPVPPQPMPLPPQGQEPEQPVASYDVDPSPGHAPPAVVNFDKPEPAGPPEPAAEAAPVSAPPVAAPVSAPPAAAPEPAAAAPAPSEETGASLSGRVSVQTVDRLRSTAERGTTTVPTPVIEKIATLAVREVPGVHAFEAGDGADGERTLAVEVDGKTATVTLHLVIEYGFAVHSVTEKVRTKVISALENLFSLDVTAVDIVIDDIHLEEVAE